MQSSLLQGSEEDLKSIAKWTKIIAFSIAFISLLIFCTGVLLVLFMRNLLAGFTNLDNISSLIIGLLFLGLGLLYYFPARYLLLFSNLISQSIEKSDETYLKMALSNLKKHYKLIGTIILLNLVLFATFIVLGISIDLL